MPEHTDLQSSASGVTDAPCANGSSAFDAAAPASAASERGEALTDADTGTDRPAGAEPRVDDGGASQASRVADAVSIASDFGAMWAAVAILQVLFRKRRPLEALVRLSATGLVSVAATRLLKHHFAVPRRSSPTPSRARTPSSPGFPSGHTLAAFTSAIALPATRNGRVLGLAAASLVGWARVRVGHHRLADVVAGAGAGTIAGAALRVVLRAARA